MEISLWIITKLLIFILLVCSPIIIVTYYASKQEKRRVETWITWIKEEIEELKKIFPNEKIEYKNSTFYFNSYKRTIYPFSKMYILVHNFWLGAMAYKKIINKGQDKLTYEAGFKEACEKIKEELKIDAQNHVCVNAKITVNYIDKLLKEQKKVNKNKQ